MLQVVPPPASLVDWIDGAVIVRAGAELPGTHFPAMTTSMLVVRLAGDVWRDDAMRQPLPAAAWIDATTRPSAYRHGGPVAAIGLIVRLAAAALLCRHGRVVQVNGFEPALTALGPEWPETEQVVRAQATDDARVNALFRHMAAAAAVPDKQARLRQRSAWIDAVRAGTAVAATTLHLSPRQVERRFRSAFGMTPKQFQTIDRLKHTLHQGLEVAETRADLAAAQGFYDQSHLGRDMRRLLGHPLALAAGQMAQPQPDATGPLWPVAVRGGTDAPAHGAAPPSGGQPRRHQR